MWKLANLLTLSRLFLAPVFIGFFVVDRPWAAVAALGVAVLFEITDLLDGYIARRFQQVTALGKLIDPLADSVSRFSVFLAFVTERSVCADPWPVLLVALIFYRDAAVAYTRIFAASTGVVLAARFSGKLKAVIQGGGIIIFLTLRAASYFHPALNQWRPLVFYAVMIPIVLVTIWSACDYVISNRAAIEAMARHEEET
jgi:CDP-diacylglycerol--glycerol-3-phosphate 3-phosphatidyltransferase